MTLDVQRFTRKPETVEAVQVTLENMAEVAEWWDGEVFESPTGRCVTLPSGVACYPGDWAVRYPDGCSDGGPRQYFPDADGWQPALPSTAQVTEYRLSPVPVTDELPDAFLWDVIVRRCYSQADGRWTDAWEVRSVIFALTADGTWQPHEPGRPLHEFEDAASALAAAGEAQWTLRVSGKTARDVLAERGEAGTDA